MKKQILFVIMAMCATCAMAVSLPSSSYNPYVGERGSAEAYTMSAGTQFMNQAVVGAYYKGQCDDHRKGGQQWTGDKSSCFICCNGQFPEEDRSEANLEARRECMNMCDLPLGESPLDAPTAFLLALVAAYGAVAVYRKRMQQA